MGDNMDQVHGNHLPVDHPEGFHMDPGFWSRGRMLELAETECEWTAHVDVRCDEWERIEEGRRRGWGDDSWLEVSITLAALRQFPPATWWPERIDR